MTLPIKVLPTDVLEIEGVKVTYRSLSRSEALKVTTQFTDNVDGAEDFIVACGTGVTEAEAAEWRASTDPHTAGALVDAILALTGLVEKGQKDPQ